jgi:tetratricopeptide (TPR) repeat protein
MVITDLLLGTPPSRELPRAVTASSPDVLFRVGIMLDMWFDSAQTAVGLANVMVTGWPGSLPRNELRMRLARILSVRGHLKAAARELLAAVDLTATPDGETLELFTELAMTGSIPAALVSRTFARWSATSPRAAVFALPWYAQERDTAALRTGASLADSFARAGTTPRSREVARYAAAAARAYHTLAVGDTAGALGRFLALPDSLCPDCYFDWRTRGDLLMRAGRLDESHQDLVRVLTYAWTVPTYPSALVQLGELEERRGHLETAAQSWRTALEAWSAADSSLAPERRRAQEGLRRLGAAA